MVYPAEIKDSQTNILCKFLCKYTKFAVYAHPNGYKICVTKEEAKQNKQNQKGENV